eukprot:scaffold123618_cov15-Tisochrysis_lutea.AAC.1
MDWMPAHLGEPVGKPRAQGTQVLEHPGLRGMPEHSRAQGTQVLQHPGPRVKADELQHPGPKYISAQLHHPGIRSTQAQPPGVAENTLLPNQPTPSRCTPGSQPAPMLGSTQSLQSGMEGPQPRQPGVGPPIPGQLQAGHWGSVLQPPGAPQTFGAAATSNGAAERSIGRGGRRGQGMQGGRAGRGGQGGARGAPKSEGHVQEGGQGKNRGGKGVVAAHGEGKKRQKGEGAPACVFDAFGGDCSFDGMSCTSDQSSLLPGKIKSSSTAGIGHFCCYP